MLKISSFAETRCGSLSHDTVRARHKFYPERHSTYKLSISCLNLKHEKLRRLRAGKLLVFNLIELVLEVNEGKNQNTGSTSSTNHSGGEREKIRTFGPRFF